jgi:ABC-type Fe3+ transport system substrate-binding protein
VPASEVIVYATTSRADTARALLAAACGATGLTARLELYGSGSLYLRLGPRHGPPAPDVILWSGPFAAAAATADGLLQPYRPPQLPDSAAHDPSWAWTALDYSPIVTVGAPTVASWQDLASVPRLAMPDPERSEAGLSILMASLDRARQIDTDVERGWTWWQQRARAGLRLAEDEAGALSLVDAGAASHAVVLSGGSSPLSGLAPMPHAVSLAAASRNVDAARRLLDWLMSASAATALAMSPWQASGNGLATLQQAAPRLDVEWARQQWTATRRRWAQSGFGPGVGS